MTHIVKTEEIYFNFYKVPRLSLKMSDEGGAFGLDIHHALEACYLIDLYNCDVIIETGTHTGDTTEFLAKMFPSLKILTCDIETAYLNIAGKRLEPYKNIEMYLESSEKFLKKYLKKFTFPFIFLDAHWNNYWPLSDELCIIKKGVVCIDDYDINYEGFDFDEYKNIKCNEKLVKEAVGKDTCIFSNNPHAEYAFPCMQKKRRSGRGYFQLGKNNNHFLKNNMFKIEGSHYAKK